MSQWYLWQWCFHLKFKDPSQEFLRYFYLNLGSFFLFVIFSNVNICLMELNGYTHLGLFYLCYSLIYQSLNIFRKFLKTCADFCIDLWLLILIIWKVHGVQVLDNQPISFLIGYKEFLSPLLYSFLKRSEQAISFSPPAFLLSPAISTTLQASNFSFFLFLIFSYKFGTSFTKV